MTTVFADTFYFLALRDLHPLEEDFWPLFWKLYLATRMPDAGNIK